MTRKTTYALRALCRLARASDGNPTFAADLADSAGIPRRFLDAILRQLTRDGVLTSTRGPRGGYALRRAPGDISVASIVRSLDGPAVPFPCLHPALPSRCAECPGTSPCPARVALERMGAAAFEVLEAMTLADLIRNVDATTDLARDDARHPSPPRSRL